MKFGIYILCVENWMVKKNYSEDFKSIFEYGWGNGYVLLPHNHPFYGRDYNELNIDAHGGLTFGEYFSDTIFLEWVEDREIIGDVNKENFQKFDKYWMIGFDTNHFGDNENSCSKKYVSNETCSILEQSLDDDIEGMRKYKSFYLRKDKLKKLYENY